MVRAMMGGKMTSDFMFATFSTALAPSAKCSTSIAGIVLFLSACVTTPEPKAEPTKPQPPKAGQTKIGSKESAPPLKPVVPPLTLPEQLEFIKRQSDSDAEFGEHDHDFTTRLPSHPAAGGISEAALFFGILGSGLQPLGLTTPSFEESDLSDGSTPQTAGNGMALEKLARERGLNLIDALNENPWLKTYGAARRVYQATRVTSDSADYKKELLAAIKQEGMKWQTLLQDMGVTPPSSSEPSAVATETALPPALDLPPPNPADLRGGDAMLAEAQALADRGNFQAAIKKASTVDQASPMYAAAQEKVREFSNLAVQDLRRKAAQAFQSAMPVTDIKVRAQYLIQAKQYLEQAIKDFPTATQLPTVRDNLRVISRDLEKIQGEPTVDATKG